MSSASLSQRHSAVEETPTDKDGRRKYIEKPALTPDKGWSSGSGLREVLTISCHIKTIFQEMLQRVLNYQRKSHKFKTRCKGHQQIKTVCKKKFRED